MENQKMIRLDVLAYKGTIQLVVAPQNDLLEIIAFASGFFLIHKERLFFITADHVIHLDDHDSMNETGQRLGVDYTPLIITNKQENDSKDFKSIFLPLGGFEYLTGYGLDEETMKDTAKFTEVFQKTLDGDISLDDETLPINVRIANFEDLAFTEIKQPLPCTILNNMVVDIDGETIINVGEKKIFLTSEGVKDFEPDRIYLVAGTVHNKIVDSIRLERANVCHDCLTFDKQEADGNVRLSTPEQPAIEDWEGLSGAPVFDSEGYLAGMLLRGPVSEPYVVAMPISKIMKFIDYYCKINSIEK